MPEATRNRFDAQRKRFTDEASKPLTNRLHCAAKRGLIAVNGWNALVLLIDEQKFDDHGHMITVGLNFHF